ncbi:MAG: histidine kinase [Armatimonadota bacterium]|nr:histidine kinase [Armatimonadota bacterium]MDR7485484.1 histidine kinase [Armatimonadota bacterium]MDR7533029.1 histidine kinase [Armatimonadota bacterium]MDR7536799.1 histidine kinase [Armatimonadota bacterium]
MRRTGWWPGLWRRVPILHRILGANAAIIVIGAVGGTLVAVRHGATHPSSPHYELIAGFLLAGVAASVLANFLVLRAVLRPLEHLQRAVDAVRAGATGVRVARDGLWDERLEHLADTFDHMVAALDEHTEQLRRLPGQILRAQEEERRRIARELHDEAAQALTSLLVRLRLLDQASEPAQVRARVRELRALTARALDDVRRIAVELRPSVLDDLGLAAALAAHADEINAAGGMRVTVAATGLDRRLPAEIELALYRIAQEALTNARRHGQATRADVCLRRGPDGVSLEVSDDGIGFDPARAGPTRGLPATPAAGNGNAGGLGLAGMAERIALVGGRLEVRSAPGTGTTITAWAPVHDGGAGGTGRD